MIALQKPFQIVHTLLFQHYSKLHTLLLIFHIFLFYELTESITLCLPLCVVSKLNFTRSIEKLLIENTLGNGGSSVHGSSRRQLCGKNQSSMTSLPARKVALMVNIKMVRIVPDICLISCSTRGLRNN